MVFRNSFTDSCQGMATGHGTRGSGCGNKFEASAWFVVGNEEMGYGDYCWGLYRDYYRDPFPPSLLKGSWDLVSRL